MIHTLPDTLISSKKLFHRCVYSDAADVRHFDLNVGCICTKPFKHMYLCIKNGYLVYSTFLYCLSTRAMSEGGTLAQYILA